MSTLEKDKQKYHHGDLRNTLVQIGTEMLIESGEASLSLRKIAQQAGVSHNAPYQHFPDKNALLAAIAEDGFRLLGEAMDVVIHDETIQEPQDRLIQAGQAYLNFAIHHPSHLQLMFGSFSSNDYPSLAQRSHETLAKLVSIVDEIYVTGRLSDDDKYDVATTAWIAIHGFSVILNAGKIPDYIQRDRTPEALIDRFIELICKGLLK